MDKIKFDRLKEKCVQEFLNEFNAFYNGKAATVLAVEHLVRIQKGETVNWRTLVPVVKKQITTAIMDVDVRCAQILRDAFPKSCPSWLLKGHFRADYDEDGDWSLYKLKS